MDKNEPIVFKKQKCSISLGEALKLLDEVNKRYEFAYDMVNRLDKEQGDLLHKLELDDGNYKSRCKIATQLRAVRKDRRYYKDIVEELAPLVGYLKDSNNQRAINKLREMLGQVRKQEAYHENRHYIPRVLKE